MITMGTFSSPVLLDITVEKSTTFSVAGLRIGKWVLSVARPVLNVLSKKENYGKKSGLINFSNIEIRCYQMDESEQSIIVSSATISRVFVCEPIQTILEKIQTKSCNLKPYSDLYLGKHKMGPSEDCFGAEFLLMKIANGQDILHEVCGPNRSVDNGSQMVAFRNRTPHVKLGEEVYTVYAPFAATEFLNSLSRGCLSNIIERVLYLIDGRLAPSCKGAPVYSSRKNLDLQHLIGFVLTPIVSSTHLTGFSFVAPAQIVFDSLISDCEDILSTDRDLHFYAQKLLKTLPLPSVNKTKSIFHNVIENCVLVEFRSGWGSGVVIAPGIVLTNSHVIDFGKNISAPVHIRWMNKSTNAKIIFHVSSTSLLDIALLQYNDQFGPKGLNLASSPPEKGEEVLCLGYPLFMDWESPSLSSGVVLSCWDDSVGFSTTCSTHPGTSGGPILRLHTKHRTLHNNADGYESDCLSVSLLGIVIGVITLDGVSFNEVNTCISIAPIHQALQHYIKTGDLKGLKRMELHEDRWLRSLLHTKCKY